MYIMLYKDNDALLSTPAIILTKLKIRTETEKDQARQREKRKCNLRSVKDD